MNYNYISRRLNHYLFLIIGLLFLTAKMGAQLPAPPVLATSNVPEASQYGVMYQFDIPDNGNFTTASAITYAVNNSTVTGLSYNRVAYFMQLDSKWVWVSMNKFNTTNAQLGIPYANSGIIFQQQVTGMNVYSSVGSGITNTVNVNGNLEIWPDCYGTGLGLGVIGGNSGNYDFNDTYSPGSNCHGSFQVHNYGASQTLFAYNSFMNGSTDELGIGTNTLNAHPDWTFMSNAPSYTTKKLYILVDQGINIITQPSTLAASACENATITPLTTSVSVTTGTITNYTWYSNTINSNSGGIVVATNSSSLTTNSYTPPTTTVGTLYYYCVITSSTGGTVTSNPSGAITINTLPSISVNSGSICAGQSFTMTPSGASTYTYTGGSSIVSPTTNTSYTVTGTSAQGCVSSSGAVSSVTVNTLPSISVNSGSICTGQSFTMTPSGASTYTYTGGSSIVSPTTNTSYTVTGTSAQGCVSSSGAVSSVTVNTLPSISVNSGSICVGQSFTMTPSGASTYTYTGGSSIVSPTTNTSYTVTGTSAQGCVSASGTVSSVTVNALPSISVNSGSICAGQSFTMTPSGASTYTYTGGTSIVSPTTNTSYTVTGTSAQGCVSSSGAVSSVTVNTLPSISVNSGSICVGQSFTMTPSGASTYTYTGGSSIVSPTTNTSYTVTGTSAQGCVSASGAVSSVTVNTLPSISVNSGSICTGQSFTMTPSGALSYTYSGGSDVVSPMSDATYSVSGTDANGCISTIDAISSVTVNSTPTISVNSGVICAGQSFTMVPIGALTYTYSGGSDVVTPTADVTYSVSGTDANGCVSLIDAISSVTVNSTPTISVNSGAICAGESFTMVPTGAVSYTYSNGSDVVTPTSDATYSVSGTDANGCVSSIDAVSSVTVNALPTITVISASICAGSTGTLTASGANTYTWNTGANTSVIIDNPLTTTVYDVSGTSSEGCLGSLVTATISVGSAPSIVVNSASVCAGSSATLTANGVTTYTWSTGDNTSSIVVTPTVNTVYSVDGDLIGCSVVASNTATVIVNDLPVITVNSGVICEGESFSIIANGADTYTYSGGSSVVMPVTTSSYTVSGTSLEGCLSSVDAISTVSVNTLPVVSLSSSSSTVCVNGTSVILTGLPTGGVYSGTNVIGNSFVPIATGTYTPVYSYTDAATGCSNSSLVSITVDVCSGVKEATITTGTVKLFPNPNNGLFSIETISSENKTITVTDVAGRVVLSDVSSEMMFNVDMRDLANGFYYVSIKTIHSMEIIKIVKE